MTVAKRIEWMIERILGDDVLRRLKGNRAPESARVCEYGHAVFSGNNLCSYGHHPA